MTVAEKFFEACTAGDLNYVKSTISSGKLEIDAKSPEGWTGLIVACFNAHFDIAKYLIENKANVNTTNQKGTSVFMYAKTPVQQNQDDTKILELLLNNGASINHLDSFNKSVLDYVNENGAFKLAKWLIAKGAKCGESINKN